MIDHYDRMNIRTSYKTLVFSDGLNPEKAVDIEKEFGGERVGFSMGTNTMYGIGTDLTNSMMTGWVAPQIVIKMTECQGRPVAKLSDSPGKCMCRDPVYLNWLAEAIKKEGEVRASPDGAPLNP
jgi:nicotinate phosphoribosyltransferase